MHVNEKVAVSLSAARAGQVKTSEIPESASHDGSLHSLLLTLANEMTPEEQRQMTSLLLREGITGLLQRLGIRDQN